MDNNTVPINPPTAVVAPVTESIQPQVTVPTPFPEPTLKKNYTKLIIIIMLVVLLIGLSIYLIYKYKNNNKNNLEPTLIETSYEKDGTKYTNTQYDDLNQKILDTSCFTSIIPKSARIIPNSGPKDDCSLRVIMPDTTLEFVKVTAIDENDKQNLRDVVYSADNTYRKSFLESGNTKYESNISENINFGGFNSYILNYFDGSMNWQTYFIDVPEDKKYQANELKVRGFFINGFANDPSVDVFSKYYKEFITNLKFK